jgi:protein-tyrosine-phosphatase
MTEPVGKPSVLFVCVKNAGKSQMAAGLMSKIAGETVDVYSAGTKPGAAVNDLSAEALAEVGVDISEQTPKLVDPQLVRAVDVVVTVGREAKSIRWTEPGSRTGTPTSLPIGASTGSNGCGWSATTSLPA